VTAVAVDYGLFGFAGFAFGRLVAEGLADGELGGCEALLKFPLVGALESMVLELRACRVQDTFVLYLNGIFGALSVHLQFGVALKISIVLPSNKASKLGPLGDSYHG
jgi:hypothetical protein